VTTREDRIGFAAIAAIVIGAVALAHFAPGAKPQAVPSSAGPDAACAEWTDGCIVCQRTDQGPACSTPGIACVRGETRCLRQTAGE
jgi:hypothetical protein